MSGRPTSAGDPVNADRMKTTWDLWIPAGDGMRPVATLADLALVLDFPVLTAAEQTAVLRSTTRLPSWRAAPEALKAEVAASLVVSGAARTVGDVKARFDESLHPRDTHGRFASIRGIRKAPRRARPVTLDEALVDTWTGLLADSADHLDLTDPDDRAAFRTRVVRRSEHTRVETLTRAGDLLGAPAPADRRSRQGAIRRLTEWWINTPEWERAVLAGAAEARVDAAKRERAAAAGIDLGPSPAGVPGLEAVHEHAAEQRAARASADPLADRIRDQIVEDGDLGLDDLRLIRHFTDLGASVDSAARGVAAGRAALAAAEAAEAAEVGRSGSLIDEFGRTLTPAMQAAKEKTKAADKPIGKIVPVAHPDPEIRNVYFGSENFPAETAEFVLSTFERDDWPGGLRTAVDPGKTRLTQDGTYLLVHGKIYERGRAGAVGTFTRVLVPPNPPPMEGLLPSEGLMSNELLALKADVQGQGFAEAFYRRAEEAAATQGITKVQVEADIDVGGYAWARRGFTWNYSRGGLSNVAGKLIERIDYGVLTDRAERETEEWTQAQRDALAALYERLTAVVNGEGLHLMPSPAEIAALGEESPWTVETANGTEIPMWPGKALMLGTEWRGVKDVGAGFETKAAADDWNRRVLAYLPTAEERWIPGDRFRPHDGETTDYNLMTADLLLGPGGETKAYGFARAARFDPDRHPRDHRGRFLDTPDVRLPGGGRGVALAADRGTVVVEREDGSTTAVAPADLTEAGRAPKPTGKYLDALGPVPAGGYTRDNLPPSVRHSPALRHEAQHEHSGSTGIVVGDKFFTLPPENQRAVLAHEVGHGLADEILSMSDQSGFDIYEVAKQYDPRPDLGAGGIPSEFIADVYMATHTGDREFVEGRFPGIAALVEAKAKEYGYPVPGTEPLLASAAPNPPADVADAVAAAKAAVGVDVAETWQDKDTWVAARLEADPTARRARDAIARLEETIPTRDDPADRRLFGQQVEAYRARLAATEQALRTVFDSQLATQNGMAGTETRLRVPRPDVKAADGGPGERIDAALDAVVAAGAQIEREAQRRVDVKFPPVVDNDGGTYDGAIDKYNKAERADRERQYRELYGTDYATVDAAIRHTLRRAQDRDDRPKVREMWTRLEEHQKAFYDLEPDLTQPDLADAKDFLDYVENLRRARMEKAKLRQHDRRRALAEARREVLAEIRPMGGTGALPVPTAPADVPDLPLFGGRGVWNGEEITDTLPFDLVHQMQLSMTQASDIYPADWNARAAVHPTRPQQLTFARRGFTDVRTGLIALSPDVAPWEGASAMLPTMVHEYGHTMEAAVPGLTALEWAFHWRRTTERDDNGNRHRPIAGSNAVRQIYLHPGEEGVQDSFKEMYTGKIYADSPQGSWEVFTTGVESLFAGATYADGDASLTAFVLGSMATL